MGEIIEGYNRRYELHLTRFRDDAPDKPAGPAVWSNFGKGKYLKPTLRGGYPRISLCAPEDKSLAQQIDAPLHKLVAKYFIANPENHPVIDHIDEDKLNCNPQNLRWTTISINNHNSSKHRPSISPNATIRMF